MCIFVALGLNVIRIENTINVSHPMKIVILMQVPHLNSCLTLKLINHGVPASDQPISFCDEVCEKFSFPI